MRGFIGDCVAPVLMSAIAFTASFLAASVAQGIENEFSIHQLPEPKFWIEGSAGKWGPGNPFYETRTTDRRKLIGYLNRHPSTIPQTARFFGIDEEKAHEDIAALEMAGMLKILREEHGEKFYAPTFAILTTEDFDIAYPHIEKAASAYVALLAESFTTMDSIASDCGLGAYGRLPIFLAFVRDEMVYKYMDRNKLFAESGTCPKYGSGNFYGAEPYPRIDSAARHGLTHCTRDHYGFVYIYPYFKSRKLFAQWGFEKEWQVCGTFDAIIWTLDDRKPSTVKEIAGRINPTGADREKVKALFESGRIYSMLDYLESQSAIAQVEGGYIKTTGYIDKRIMSTLREISDPATEEIAKLLRSETFEGLYRESSRYRNEVPIGQFREAAGWKTVWLAAGMMAERGLLPDLEGTNRELFVLERRDKRGIGSVLYDVFLWLANRLSSSRVKNSIPERDR